MIDGVEMDKVVSVTSNQSGGIPLQTPSTLLYINHHISMTTAPALASAEGSTSYSTGITTHHTYIPSPLPSAPGFNLHLTRFRDTLLIWVGTAAAESTFGDEEPTGAGGERRLAADWSVAMPSRGVCHPYLLEICWTGLRRGD
jgi:hypothetical protein